MTNDLSHLEQSQEQIKKVSFVIPVLNESKHMGNLLESLLRQNYRPLEIILVDGGSKDGTLEIVSRFTTRFDNSKISFRLFDEKLFSGLLGPAHARNVGILNSSGNYLFFIDADFLLLDSSTVEKVVKALDKYPAVAITVDPSTETFVEKQVAMDDYSTIYKKNVHNYFALCRSALDGLLFDENLGFGEDSDLFERAGIKPVLIDLKISRHYCHSLDEYSKQWFWYGRTTIPLLRKNSYNQITVIKSLFTLSIPFFLLVGALISAFFEIKVSFILIVLYFVIVGVRLFRSPVKKPLRIIYLTFGTFFRSYYYTIGLFLFLIKRNGRLLRQR